MRVRVRVRDQGIVPAALERGKSSWSGSQPPPKPRPQTQPQPEQVPKGSSWRKNPIPTVLWEREGPSFEPLCTESEVRRGGRMGGWRDDRSISVWACCGSQVHTVITRRRRAGGALTLSRARTLTRRAAAIRCTEAAGRGSTCAGARAIATAGRCCLTLRWSTGCASLPRSGRGRTCSSGGAGEAIEPTLRS